MTRSSNLTDNLNFLGRLYMAWGYHETLNLFSKLFQMWTPLYKIWHILGVFSQPVEEIPASKYRFEYLWYTRTKKKSDVGNLWYDLSGESFVLERVISSMGRVWVLSEGEVAPKSTVFFWAWGLEGGPSMGFEHVPRLIGRAYSPGEITSG